MDNSAVKGEGRNSGEQGASLRVLWTVSGYLLGKNPVWEEKETKSLLFKPLDITPTSIDFAGQVCHDVTFITEEVEAGPYLREQLQVTPEELHIAAKTIQVIKTNCSLPGFSEYVRLPDRRLVVPMHGVLFIFEPAVNY